MPPRQVRYTAQDVQDHVRGMILERRLGPGDPLPTETELMEALGVSRNSVREALKGLQAMRIVEIRHGFGTYVGSLSLEPMVEGLTFRTLVRHRRGENALHELTQLREALEGGLIGPAIEVMPPEDPGVLEGLVAMMEQEAEEGAVSLDTERSFHLTLYRGLDNHLLSELLDAFWDTYHRVRREVEEGQQRQAAAAIAAQHREIHSAISLRDTDRARRALAAYFDGMRERMRAAE